MNRIENDIAKLIVFGTIIKYSRGIDCVCRCHSVTCKYAWFVLVRWFECKPISSEFPNG